MTHNPELISEVKSWFIKAAHDIRMAELALRDDPPLTDQAVYHAQQSAEKAIGDRAAWRDDERRWCREGKLPKPGWWG